MEIEVINLLLYFNLRVYPLFMQSNIYTKSFSVIGSSLTVYWSGHNFTLNASFFIEKIK